MVRTSTRTQNFTHLGEDFQESLIKVFIEDKDTFKKDLVFVNQNAFTNQRYKVIVGFLKDFVQKNDYVPSYDTLVTFIATSISNDIELEIIRETIRKIQNKNTEGWDLVKAESVRFFKQQELIKFFNENLERISRGNDIGEGLQEELGQILAIGNHDNIWTGVYDNKEETFSPENIVHIPIGSKEIDDYLQGGIIKGNLVLVAASSGVGKAQPLRELIATPNGFVRMGDIKVGDEVLGSNGKPVNVIGVFPQGERDTYRVHFKDKTFVDCDYDHLWNVNTYYQRVAYKFKAGVSKRDNSKGTRCDKRYKMPDYTYRTMSLREICSYKLKNWNGSRKFKIPTLNNPVEFSTKELKINPYLFGYFIGDGTFGRCSISIGKSDHDTFSKLLDTYNSDYSFYHHHNKKRELWNIQCEQKFCQDLACYFHRDTKSVDKYIPIDYLYNSIENRILLLNGLMDSDGTCDKNGRASFSTKSKQLAENVKTLVLSLGGYAIITSKKRGYFNKKYNEYRDCGIHYNVQISLCDINIPIFKFIRKQERVIYRNKYKDDRYIDKVEYIGKEGCQCIKVDAEDELYLTKDFIVTHNTSISTAIAQSAATCKCKANKYEGFKVMQIYFEDNHKAIRRKHMGAITEIEAMLINTHEHAKRAEELAEEYEHKDLIKKNIKLGRFRSGQMTPQQIKQYITLEINKGFKPDMVIIDYFECVANPVVRNITNEWKLETEKMRQLENMIVEFDIALVTTTQGTKESAEGKLLRLHNISGSAGKYQVGHMVITLNRTEKDAKNNEAELFIPKNREGRSGQSFRIYLNNGCPKIKVIESYDDTTQMREAQFQEAQLNSLQNHYLPQPVHIIDQSSVMAASASYSKPEPF